MKNKLFCLVMFCVVIALSFASGAFAKVEWEILKNITLEDTPKDIACARACGACAVAVATGTFNVEVLATFQPDHLFENFVDISFFLEAIGL